jgi:hypothetical protein
MTQISANVIARLGALFSQRLDSNMAADLSPELERLLARLNEDSEVEPDPPVGRRDRDYIADSTREIREPKLAIGKSR